MPLTYPTETDLERYLIGTGIVNTTPQAPFTFMDLNEFVQAAKSNFEGRVGRAVLAVSQTRTYDPPMFPRTKLPLVDDLAQLTSLSITGVAKVLNTDFFLLPENADMLSKPFNLIDFAVPIYAGRKSISITGFWGYALVIPDGPWASILARAAMLAHPQLAAAVSRGFVSWKEDDVSETYGTDPLGFLRDQWEKIYEGGVEKFRKVTVYL